MAKITLHVEGMQCGHCEIAVGDALKKIDGVTKAKVSKRKQRAEVTYDEHLVTPEVLVETVTATGYNATLEK